MMPQLVTISIRDPRQRPIRLWIPLIPVLLVFSPLLVLALVVGTVACLIYGVNPGLALIRGCSLLCASRGTLIDVEHGRRTVYVAIR
jgi:hypothetical protein